MNPFDAVVWKPDGSELVSVNNGIERHWSSEGKEISADARRIWGVRSVSLSRDGKRLAINSWDKNLRSWDFGASTRPEIVGSDYYVVDAVWNPDATTLATIGSDGLLRLRDVEERKFIAEWRIPAGSEVVAWNHAGTKLATGGRASEPIQLWNPDGSAGPRFENQPHDVARVDWSADDSLLAVAYKGNTDNLRILNAATGEVVRALKGHENEIRDLKWSFDGRFLATASLDRTTRIWHANGELAQVLHGDSDFTAIAWSRDDKQVLGENYDGKCYLWKASGELIRTWAARQASIHHVGFREDGQELFTASEDATVRCVSLASGECSRLYIDLNGGKSAIFSASGQPLELPDDAANELVYLVENPDGTLEMLGMSQFIRHVRSLSHKTGKAAEEVP